MARDDAALGSAPRKVKKTRWYHQVWQAYQMTRRNDPAVTWLLLAAFIGSLAVFLVVGVLLHSVVYWAILGVPFGLLASTIVLSRRVEKAAFAQIEGQPGATLSALSTIRRGWTITQEPVAVDPRTQDLVFRAVGRPGVVLIGEGPAHRIGRLLESERKRTARVVSGAPVTLLQMGDEEGQIPLRRIARHVQRLKPTLTKQEVAEVIKRLNALGAMKLPVPKGVDPMRMRPDRKGMRGR